jgi:hypothetical protein
MHPVMDDSGPHWGSSIADKITIELRNGSNYNTVVYSVSNIDLGINGNANVVFPSNLNGNYYITLLHRNSIETVSALPVSFSTAVINYSFDSDTKAFGGNIKQKPGNNWVIYSGDVNQDGIIDSGDMIPLDNAAANFLTGFLTTDLNGDGLVDSGDMIILDNNVSLFIAKIVP